MTRRSNNPFYINDDTQEIVCVDIRYRVHLQKHQKAGKWGRYIYCPRCNNEHLVRNLAWYKFTCMKCEITSKKSEWWTRANHKQLTKRVAFVNPKVKAYVPHPHVHYGKDSVWEHY
jgi:transcription elongation factor Elf1